MVLAFTGTSLRAQEERADRRFMDNVMSAIGLKREKPNIEYRERGGLVVPPSLNLPPPQTGGTQAAANPAWPKDQDVKRNQELERLRKGGGTAQTWDEYDDWKSGREMTTAERNVGRLPKGTERPVTGNSSDGKAEIGPGGLGFTGWTWRKFFGNNNDMETGTFTQEPVRQSLIEPPPGYRTPSPDQPYGARKSVTERTKQYDITTNQTGF